MELLALLDVAAIVFCLGIGCSVFGLMICRLFQWQWMLQQGLGLNAVFGLAATLLFLEIWNLFYPVNHTSIWILSLFTLGSAILLWRTTIGVFRGWIRDSGILVPLSLLVLLLTVSWFALGPSERSHYDVGLYYLSAIRWAREYPVVPGLANLDTRLGFNQSLFLFVAFLANLGNLGLERACQVANPIVVFISGWAVLDRLKLNLAMPKARRARLYAVLLLCPLFFLASHIWISAPTSDIAAAAFALPGALASLCCLEEILDQDAFHARNWILMLTVIEGTMTKLKLSYLILGGVAVGVVAIAFIFIQRRQFYRLWIQTVILAAAVMLPWAARGVILSGYPFYPSTLIRFHTDWTVSREYADNDRDSIYSWAKWPGKSPEAVLQNGAWFGPWLQRNAEDPENIFLFRFLTAGLISTLFSLVIPMSRQQRLPTALLMLPPALALFFWFKTAPDPRFAYAILLLIGVNGFYAAGSAISGFSAIRAAFYSWAVTLASSTLIFTNQWPLISWCEKKFPQGFPKAELEYHTTESGLQVGVANEQPWDSGLVVTPYFDPKLALRGSGLRDGFRIKRTGPQQKTSNN